MPQISAASWTVSEPRRTFEFGELNTSEDQARRMAIVERQLVLRE